MLDVGFKMVVEMTVTATHEHMKYLGGGFGATFKQRHTQDHGISVNCLSRQGKIIL